VPLNFSFLRGIQLGHVDVRVLADYSQLVLNATLLKDLALWLLQYVVDLVLDYLVYLGLTWVSLDQAREALPPRALENASLSRSTTFGTLCCHVED